MGPISWGLAQLQFCNLTHTLRDVVLVLKSNFLIFFSDYFHSCVALSWMALHPGDDTSTLVQVMAWYQQATNHYLNQCWPWSMSPYAITRPVKFKVRGMKRQCISNLCCIKPMNCRQLKGLYCCKGLSHWIVARLYCCKGSCHLVTIIGTTTLAPSHSCQVTTADLKRTF